MSEQCPFCVEARTEAAKQVHKWLVSTREPIPRNRANYLQAYVRLGHRIDLAEGHTLWTTPGISELSKRLSREGVGSLSPTREDMQRYRGILDALVAELEEDGSL